MKRRSNFKTVYLCILAALAVICVLCVIHVHSILVDYENSQPENVALARVQALGDRPLSDLMDTSSLTAEETAQIDAYHALVRERLTPRLTDEADRRWLAQATMPIG